VGTNNAFALGFKKKKKKKKEKENEFYIKMSLVFCSLDRKVGKK
jgi:hypothetical protein